MPLKIIQLILLKRFQWHHLFQIKIVWIV